LGIGSWIKQKFIEHRSKNTNNFDAWFKPYNIFERRTGHTLANNEIIFAAITRLANAMASLPIKLYRGTEHQPGHFLDSLIGTAPNNNMTSFGFIQTMEVLRNTYGNAYVMKQYDNNMVVESLNIIDPTCVEPMLDEATNELWYRVNAPAGRYYVHNHEMIHVRHIATGYKGISPIDVLRNTVQYDNKIRKISIEQMENAIKASFALKVATNLSPDKRTALKKDFDDFYTKNGGVIIIESGQALDAIKSEFIDPKLFEAEKITRSRVALVFGLPPHKLGEEASGSNEEQTLGFIQDTLLPMVRQYEQEFDRKLLSTDEKNGRGYGFKFSLSGLLRADTKTRGEFYFRGIRSGFFKPNEVRAWEELPPAPGGDRLYMSRDLRPIDESGKGGEDDRTNNVSGSGD